MRHRVLPVLLTIALFACPVAAPEAALAAPQTNTTPAAAPTQPDTQSDLGVSPELLAQGAGALLGFAAFSLFIAPQAAATGGVAGLLGGRLAATALAGAGAIAGMTAYDVWSGLPINYAYFWHRGGFVAGVAAGVAAFGVLGYPGGGGTTWLGWAANRGALLGTGLFGSWMTDRWYHGR